MLRLTFPRRQVSFRFLRLSVPHSVSIQLTRPVHLDYSRIFQLPQLVVYLVIREVEFTPKVTDSFRFPQGEEQCVFQTVGRSSEIAMFLLMCFVWTLIREIVPGRPEVGS